MKIWFNNAIESRQNVYPVTGSRVRIGRKTGNDIVLDSPFVAEEAAVLHHQGDGWQLVALGLGGVQVGEQEVRGGERIAIKGNENVRIFPFNLQLDLLDDEKPAGPEEILREKLSRLMQQLHLDLLSRIDMRGEDAIRISDEYLLTLERNIEEVARLRGLAKATNADLVSYAAGECVRSRLLDRMLASSPRSTAGVWGGNRHWSRLVTAVQDREETLQRTIDHLTRELGVSATNDGDLGGQIDRVEKHFWTEWWAVAPELFDEDKQYFALWQLKKQIKDIFFGYGPLEDLLRIPVINEIMVVDSNHIYVEKNGMLENSGRRFISDAVTLSIIERIVSRVGRRIDKSQPLVDARLADGSRVNAVIPPLAVSGPTLTIRKFSQRALLIDDLVKKDSLSRTVAEFLRASVRTRRNVIISGGTGTGKTTLLNCLSDFIPDKERIVTVEDTAELQLKKEHVVRMETKHANLDGKGAYTIRDLVKNSLRMRPDRIIIGECRGGEALDMLQAMNTGHDGSLTTIHANTCEDVILRLEVLVQMAADLPVQSIHRQIASAVDLIVQLTRLRDGRRVVSQIAEVTGVDSNSGKVTLKDLFALADVNGRLQLTPTGRLPSFMSDLIRTGLIELETFYL